MTLAVAVKFLHVLLAVWFVGGLIGRAVILRLASREQNVGRLGPLLDASGIFERFMVIPGWTAVLVTGVFTAWLAGYPVLGFLQGRGPNWVPAAIVVFLTILLWVPLVFVPRGRAFGAALEEARRVGSVTPTLTTAFNDPVVRVGHVYEFAAVILLFYFMVVKPF
jgi:uncharacterized membrane protein